MSSVPLHFTANSPDSRVSSPRRDFQASGSGSSPSGGGGQQPFGMGATLADLRREEKQRKELYHKFKKNFNAMQQAQLEADDEEETMSSRPKKGLKAKSPDGPQKKAKMRTASDVCNRIRWDPNLAPRIAEFGMGYLDRFMGVVDTPFAEFCWEDVPLHRIQYFRYRRRVVWDKRKRLDHFFGSTAPPGMKQWVTIDQVILEEDEEDEGEEGRLFFSARRKSNSLTSSGGHPDDEDLDDEEEDEEEEEEEEETELEEDSNASLEFELELDSPQRKGTDSGKRPQTSATTSKASPNRVPSFVEAPSPTRTTPTSSQRAIPNRRQSRGFSDMSSSPSERGFSRSLPSKIHLEPALDLALDPEFKLISDSCDRDAKKGNANRGRYDRGGKRGRRSSDTRNNKNDRGGRGRSNFSQSRTPLGPAPAFVKAKKNLYEEADSDEDEDEVGFFPTEEEEISQVVTTTTVVKKATGSTVIATRSEAKRIRSVSATEGRPVLSQHEEASFQPSTSAPSPQRTTPKKVVRISDENDESDEADIAVTPPTSMMSSRTQWHEMKRQIKLERKEKKVQERLARANVVTSELSSFQIEEVVTSTAPTLAEQRRARKEAKKLAKEQQKRNQAGKRLGKGNTTTRPNYFVSIRAHHPSVVSFVQAVQSRIVERYSYFDEAMIDPNSLHFTLNVMRLSGPEDIEKAKQAMDLFHMLDLPTILPDSTWPHPLPGWWPETVRKGGNVVKGPTFGIDSSTNSSGTDHEHLFFDLLDTAEEVELAEILAEDEQETLTSGMEEDSFLQGAEHSKDKEAEDGAKEEASESSDDEGEAEIIRTSPRKSTPSDTSTFRFVLPLSGLGKFPRGEVLFAHVGEGPELIKLHEIFHALRKRFQEVGLGKALADGARPYQPHLTVFKLTKVGNPKRKKRLKMASQGAFSEAAAFSRECSRLKRFESTAKTAFEEAPWQPVSCIELSSMLEKDADRYYRCVHRIHL